MEASKLISFALWGDKTLYTDGALMNARRWEEFYPGWKCRFYIDDTVPDQVVKELESCGCEIRVMQKTIDVLGMFWRFHPMFEDVGKVSHFIVRDTDSFFSKREADAVNEWVESDKPFHIIRDCESHNIWILGGTWGAVPGCIPNFELVMKAFIYGHAPDRDNPRGLYHGADQIFLSGHVWKYIVNNHMAHIRKNSPKLRFTGKEIELPELTNNHYIGMVYNEGQIQ